MYEAWSQSPSEHASSLIFFPQALLPKPPPAASEPARTRAVSQLAEQGDGGDVKASAASCCSSVAALLAAVLPRTRASAASCLQLLQLCCSSVAAVL